jgi:hypothetical protein
MESTLSFATTVLLIGTVVFLEVWHSKERQKLLDRIQAKSFPEYKAFEAKEENKAEKKDAPEPPVYL